MARKSLTRRTKHLLSLSVSFENLPLGEIQCSVCEHLNQFAEVLLNTLRRCTPLLEPRAVPEVGKTSVVHLLSG